MTQPSGRWPPDVVITHSPECVPGQCVDWCVAVELDKQSGNRPGAVSNGSKTTTGLAGTSTFRIHERPQVPGYGDSGGCSRFYPQFWHHTNPPTSERRTTVRLIHGDCLDALRTLPDRSVDAVVTDPPSSIGFMGLKWDSDRGGRDQWIAWLTERLVECYRVLKPGAHIVVWALPKTSGWTHRAIEDAGFEHRHGLAALHGQGFPKNLDVSKAIDKAAGKEREVVGRYASPERTSGRSNHADRVGLSTRIGGLSEITAPATEDAERWSGWGTALKPSWEMWYLARKPLDSPSSNVTSVVESALRERGVEGDIRWTKRHASGAAKRGRSTSSSPTPAPTMASETSAAHAVGNGTPNTETPTAKGTTLPADAGTGITTSTPSEGTGSEPTSSATKSLPPTGPSAPVAAKPNRSSSPSTTSTVADQLTERFSRTSSTPSCAETDTPPVTESFAGIATGLTGSQAHVLINRLSDGTFVWPDGLPEVLPGGKMTVAGTVCRWGTGALNVDACRVAADAPIAAHLGANNRRTSMAGGVLGGYQPGDAGRMVQTSGRWPADVLLSHSAECDGVCSPGCAVAELDRQSGTLKSGRFARSVGDVVRSQWRDHEGREDVQHRASDACWEPSEGGASRFYATFRYQAKPSTREKNNGLDHLPEKDRNREEWRLVENATAKSGQRAELPRRNTHPTVKPVELMRWLVRLVTPPGGTVLDPFAGSGSTLVAATLEGFDSIGVEAEAEYLPLIEGRVRWAEQQAESVAPTLFGEMSCD